MSDFFIALMWPIALPILAYFIVLAAADLISAIIESFSDL